VVIPDPVDIVGARRQLHGVAESFIAGPQYRAHGTIRLVARPRGISGTALPVSVEQTSLVWPGGRAPLRGPVQDLAEASGIAIGPPPADVYPPAEALRSDAILVLDTAAVQHVFRALFAGHCAVKAVVAESDPVLWPEHFDVGAAADEVNYGVSAGDDYHPLPYAYVGPWAKRDGAFWNAPFGALADLDTSLDVDTLAAVVSDFFRSAQKQL